MENSWKRFLLQLTIGGIPHEGILRSIELLGTEVAPAVREEIARRTAEPRAPSTATIPTEREAFP